jgi:hypothetical protein
VLDADGAKTWGQLLRYEVPVTCQELTPKGACQELTPKGDYLYHVKTKDSPAASSKGDVRELVLYCADSGSLPSQPARTIPLRSSQTSSVEGAFSGGDRYELVPLDTAAGRFPAVGLTAEFEPGLKPFVEIFLTSGHVPPAFTLFSLLREDGVRKMGSTLDT